MDPELATELKRQLARTVRDTLYGSNDPADRGDLRRAVEELAEVVEVLINAVADRHH